MQIKQNNAIWCDCGEPHHVISAHPDPDFCMSDGPGITLSVTLRKPTLWHRLRYLLRLSERERYFDVTLTKEHAGQLRWMADFLEAESE